jgi:hypothetical protein
MYYYVPSREVESSRVSTPDGMREMVGGGIDSAGPVCTMHRPGITAIIRKRRQRRES